LRRRPQASTATSGWRLKSIAYARYVSRRRGRALAGAKTAAARRFRP
jgi:hypothetical protein